MLILSVGSKLILCLVSISELKNALRGLGARYPEAYEQFVRQLQPETNANRKTKMRFSDDKVIHEQLVVPQEISPQNTQQGAVVARQVKPHFDEDDLIGHLVDVLPIDGVILEHEVNFADFAEHLHEADLGSDEIILEEAPSMKKAYPKGVRSGASFNLLQGEHQ